MAAATSRATRLATCGSMNLAPLTLNNPLSKAMRKVPCMNIQYGASQ